MANKFQQALLSSYPGIDLLPIDATDADQVEAAVAADTVGDTLFSFLWRELGDVGADGLPAVLKSLQSAIGDIEAVAAAFRRQPDLLADPEGEEPTP